MDKVAENGGGGGVGGGGGEGGGGGDGGGNGGEGGEGGSGGNNFADSEIGSRADTEELKEGEEEEEEGGAGNVASGSARTNHKASSEKFIAEAPKNLPSGSARASDTELLETIRRERDAGKRGGEVGGRLRKGKGRGKRNTPRADATYEYMGDLLLASLTSAAAPGAGAVGAGGIGAGTGTPRSASWNSSGRRRAEDKRAEGMMDWLAGLVRGMTATRLERMDRAERQALMAETAELVVQMLDKRAAEDGFAHRSEVSALRRLQREAFQDLLRVKDRLHKLEYYTGIRRLQPFGAATAFPASPPSASGAGSAGFGGSAGSAGGAGGAGMDLGGGFGFGLLGGSRTRMYGEVAAGSAFVPAEGERSHSARAGLEQAGMRSGLTVKLRLDTLCRRWGSGGNSSNTGNSGGSGGSGTGSGSSSSSSGGGSGSSGKSGGAGSSGGSAQGKRREPEDLLVTELTSGLGEESSSFMLGGPVNLHKVLYSAALWDGVHLAVAPLGAVGSDVAEPINPLKDQGLTRFSSGGLPLHRRARGSALALTLRSASSSFSLAHFLSGWGVTPDPDGTSPGLCVSSLAQLSLQPQENVVLAFSALNRVWPAPPLLASNGLHWSEMGPLVLPRVNPFGWGGREGSAGGDGSSEASFGSGVGGVGGRGRGRGGDEGEEGEGGGGAGQELWLPPQDEPGTAVQSVAVAGAIQIGKSTTVAAWAQAENGDCLDEEAKRRLQWSVSLAYRPWREGDGGEEGGGLGDGVGEGMGGQSGEGSVGLGSGSNNSNSNGGGGGGSGGGRSRSRKKQGQWWERAMVGACVGSSQPDVFSGGMENEDGAGALGLVQGEVYVQVPCARGVVLQPGVVVAHGPESGLHTAYMLRTCWEL
ncbi:unnamed protein product [Closterium sp. Naga37s-1]|nr:unnamed protein product [Closterium sp. Naga37s-1]